MIPKTATGGERGPCQHGPQIRLSRHVVIAFFMLLIPFSGYASDLGEVYLRFIAGDAQIRLVDASDWVPVPANTPLQERDQVWIPEGGRAELAFRDGTLLRLDQSSGLEIVSVQRDRPQLYLPSVLPTVSRALRSGSAMCWFGKQGTRTVAEPIWLATCPKDRDILRGPVSSPVVETGSVAPTSGPRTLETGHAGHVSAERIVDKVARPQGTGVSPRGSPETRVSNTHAPAARMTASFSSSQPGSRGSFRGSSSRGRR